MTFTRSFPVVLFASLTFALAVQLNAVPSAVPTLPSGTGGQAAAALQKPSFALPVVYGTGGYSPSSVAVGDVNGDGKLDLVVMNECTDSRCFNGSGTVGVLLGKGDGTLQPAVSYSSGGLYPLAVTLGDVNGDGKLDLVVVNQCASDCSGLGSIGVLLGNGDGTFQTALEYSSGGSHPLSVALGDANGDGKPDLLLANNECAVAGCNGKGTVGVLLGNGDGTFRMAVTYDSGGLFAGSIAVGDVNRDSKLDLLVTSGCTSLNPSCTSGVVGVLLGNGDGTFQSAVTYITGGQTAGSLALADVNADGRLDLLVSTCPLGCVTGVVEVLLGNGDGTFQPAVSYGSGGVSNDQVPFFSFAVGDLNGDRKLDLLVLLHCGPTSCGDSRVAVLLGNGDGTFQTAVPYSSGQWEPSALAVGDLNGDGKLDMLVGNSSGGHNPNVAVRLNTLQLATKTALTSTLNPSHLNQSVRLTARISGLYAGTTTGAVMFKQGLKVLGTATVRGGKAALSHTFTKTGTFSITAIYAGDSNSKKSTSAVLKQVVTP